MSCERGVHATARTANSTSSDRTNPDPFSCLNWTRFSFIQFIHCRKSRSVVISADGVHTRPSRSDSVAPAWPGFACSGLKPGWVDEPMASGPSRGTSGLGRAGRLTAGRVSGCRQCCGSGRFDGSTLSMMLRGDQNGRRGRHSVQRPAEAEADVSAMVSSTFGRMDRAME